MYLVELTLDMVRQVLKPGGNYAVKVFQGEGSEAFLKDVRSSFEKVMIRKPEASRPRSRSCARAGPQPRGLLTVTRLEVRSRRMVPIRLVNPNH